jgi:uncharacterized protein YcbK (DUF882 family)
MITPKEYLMGRDKDFPLDMRQAINMADLLSRVNHLIATFKISTRVTSGYRPSAINKNIGGAKMSTHTVCAGIDLLDTQGEIGKMLKSNVKILEEYGLYLESPDHTKGWIHLDTKARKNRIFIP